MSYNFEVKFTDGNAEVNVNTPKHVPDGRYVISGHVVPDGEVGNEFIAVSYFPEDITTGGYKSVSMNHFSDKKAEAEASS